VELAVPVGPVGQEALVVLGVRPIWEASEVLEVLPTLAA